VKKILTPEEAIIFKQDVDKVATELSKFLSEFITNNPGFSAEGIVYALLGGASFVASSTGCVKETYLGLAELAFDSESKNDELLINVSKSSDDEILN
jgi:hypothetical protein